MLRLLTWILVLSAPAVAQVQKSSSAGTISIAPVVTGLDTPWAVAPLPGGAFLITERDGALLLGVPGRGVSRVSGVPDVWASGQGGLLDVVAARDFAATSEIFLTFSMAGNRGAGTALAVARLDRDAAALHDLRIIFRMNASSRKGQHFGSRVVEAPDGTLFLTIGDRGAAGLAQSLDVHNGKVVRVTRSGGVPKDNPFATGPAPEIWSYGHRNAQGAALDLSGRLWTVEHGARGGDEVNRPQAGRNYGWPVISYGTHYSGAKIGEGTAKAGMEQPAHYWDPSIAPSGMMIYSGKLWPAWRGDMFVGSLKFDYVSRLELSGNGAREVEQLFPGAFARIRDIREAPDGAIWFISIGEGAVFRMTPG